MPAAVYFSSLRNPKFQSPLDKLTRLLEKIYAPKRFFSKGDLVAIKVHFGELGNTSFLRPVLLRPVIEFLRKLQVNPYLTDTNTLYTGMRTNSVDHLHNAVLNGFSYTTLGAPVIIADGLRGENTLNVETGFAQAPTARLAADIVHADGMVVVSHFKGHEVSGFGGAIKNLSMGCASRQGKLDMHSQTRPLVDPALCTGCGRCQAGCLAEAIDLLPKAVISDRCVGCARCLAICPERAVKIEWNESSANTQKKMVEYAATVVRELKFKTLFINVLSDISPACDCYPGNDAPLVGDIGYVASDDPVAADKASYDLVVKAAGGEDPFQQTYNYLDPQIQFKHAHEIRFGNAEYSLHELD